MAHYGLPALHYASAAARLRSFSAAAREAGVSQPTVSAAVAELEAVLGARLFLRSGRQLGLTAEGERLLPRIDAVVGAVALLQAESRELSSAARQELRIGFTPLMGAGRLALLLEPFEQRHAGVRLLFFESSVADLEQRLDAGQLDVIVGCGFRRLRTRGRARLLEDELALCSPQPPLGAGGAATLPAASRERLLLTADLCGLASATRGLFEAAGLPIQAYPGRAMSYGALEDWVDLGLGSAVIPRFHVRRQALARPLLDAAGAPLTLALEAVWRRGAAGAGPVAAFLTFVHRVVPTLARGLAA
ncbi:LysR family transcriptional regulator [Aquincola sp. J276]|uniref:LysR family transcriptional regulator n=1 Tax=Aquincola sp. J276 TaxID=2898432 RepID=UPI00215174F6|nr:LysR family transcriptional regulator [Aquincola sp. J276]MCR5865394.1 LysR family transcriptional regulator [Aquincola sp. J276]